MSEIFDNAIASLRIGIEDLETGDDDRVLSAARNYYAGLLLLAKECLLRAAPQAEAMDIIGAKFKPVPDGDGGVAHEVVGYATVDLAQLRARFKDFDLAWPDADIKKLQRFRNDLEHFHLKEPAGALREAIAASFPMVVDFFAILEEDPQELLEGAWETILSEQAAFAKVQSKCLASWDAVEWPAAVEHLDRMSCPDCGSSLIGQVDPENTQREAVESKCFSCGSEFGFEQSMALVVEASFGIDDYIAAKEGLNPAINDCPECSEPTYVESGGISVCFCCGESIAGECVRCSTGIDINEYNPEYPNLCSYCVHTWEKVMRE